MPTLLRHLCGDNEITKDRMEDFRFGPEFKHLDSVVDNQKRKTDALHRLERILRIRDATRPFRTAVQEQTRSVLAGEKTEGDVRREIEQQFLELAEEFPSIRSEGRQILWEIAAPSTELLLDLAREGGKTLPIVGMAIAAAESIKGINQVRERRELADRLPLAHFMAIASRIANN